MKFRNATIAALLMSLSLIALAGSPQGPGRGPGQGAQPGPGGQPGQQDGPPPRRGPGPDERMLFHFLDLTDAQKSQIKTIDEAERAKVEPLVQQIRAAHEAIEAATAHGQFNEQQVRALAAAEAQVQVELTVAHVRRQAAVYQVLTPEQRAKLDRFLEEHRPPQGEFQRVPRPQ